MENRKPKRGVGDGTSAQVLYVETAARRERIVGGSLLPTLFFVGGSLLPTLFLWEAACCRLKSREQARSYKA